MIVRSGRKVEFWLSIINVPTFDTVYFTFSSHTVLTSPLLEISFKNIHVSSVTLLYTATVAPNTCLQQKRIHLFSNGIRLQHELSHTFVYNSYYHSPSHFSCIIYSFCYLGNTKECCSYVSSIVMSSRVHKNGRLE